MRNVCFKKSRFIALFCAAAMLLGSMFVQNATRVSADDLTTFEIVGASVRISADGESDGLRFETQISKVEYDGLADVISTGTLVIPKRILGGGVLDLANGDALNIDTTDLYEEKGEVYEFKASLIGIPEKNYLSGIVGRSYIQTSSGVYYTDAVERSVSYVANAAMNDAGSYTQSQIESIRKLQKVTADTELQLNFASAKPIANAVPVAMEEGDVLSMEFFLLESADMVDITKYNQGNLDVIFGVAGAPDDYLGGTNGSNIAWAKSGVSYTGSIAPVYEDGYDGTGYNFATVFRVGNRIKAEYTYSASGSSLSVYLKRPADADYVKMINRTNVANVSNAVLGMWGTGYVALQIKDLAFKYNGTPISAVSLDNSLNTEKIFADSEKGVSTAISFTGAGNYTYGSKNNQVYPFSLGYNQTLVWTFDITAAEMNARIGFYATDGDPTAHPYSGIRSSGAVMIEYQTPGFDWWGGTAHDTGSRTYQNVFRAGWSYKLEYKTESYEGAADGSLILYELDDGVYYQRGRVTGLNVVSGHCPMDNVKLSIAVISGTASFTMRNQMVYVVETGARCKTATNYGSVTVS